MKPIDVLTKIVYFDYCGETEQAYVKNIINDKYVTICSTIHMGQKDKELYTEMPISIDELYLNPIKGI